MQLEELTVALRPRQPWEAVDLGCTLVRRDYGRLLVLWLITCLPLWALLAALLWQQPAWFLLAVRWLKPLYGRVPLHFLSRAAFGMKPTLDQSLREWPHIWSRFLLSSLVFRRLSLMRSFALPVWMLEGQRARQARKRVKALASDGGSNGTALTSTFIWLETAVWLGLIALLNNISFSPILPGLWEIVGNPDSLLDLTPLQLWFISGLYLVAMTLIEPFYVGAGFALYLNSRAKIEGWDIELAFRRLAARLRLVAATGVAFVMLGLLLPVATQAQEGRPTTAASTDVEKVMQDILAKPEFTEHQRTQKRWIPDATTKDARADRDAGDFWLGRIFYGLGMAVALGLLFLAVRWLCQNKHLFTPGPRKARPVAEPPPRVVMGLDITTESLPQDILVAAHTAWIAGHERDALSLLYRGSLSRLVLQHRLPIRGSDTEDDCLLHVAHLGDTRVTNFFRQLTLLWMRAAYAGQQATLAEFDNLCHLWPFAPAASPAQKRHSKTAALLAMLILPTLTGCEGEWKDEKTTVGYQGKARVDPFLAAQLLLQEYGHGTTRLPALQTLPPPEYGVILVSGEAGMPASRAQQLLDWTQGGGHLIYTIAGFSPYNDWDSFSGHPASVYAGNEDRAAPILQKLGVTVTLAKSPSLSIPPAEELTPPQAKKDTPNPVHELPTAITEMAFKGSAFQVDYVDVLKLALDRHLRADEYVSGNPEEASALSLVYGQGRITLLNHARPLRNRFLDENDHASWLLALVGEEPHEVQFIMSLQSSFWALLWSRAWMALVGLALVIAAWLWMHLPRFGPRQQVSLHDTKHFAEHIGALGQFFYRMKRPDVLLGAAADAVRSRALRLHPHLAHLDNEALMDVLATASALPKERIRAAFITTGKTATHELVRRMQDLHTMHTAMK